MSGVSEKLKADIDRFTPNLRSLIEEIEKSEGRILDEYNKFYLTIFPGSKDERKEYIKNIIDKMLKEPYSDILYNYGFIDALLSHLKNTALKINNDGNVAEKEGQVQFKRMASLFLRPYRSELTRLYKVALEGADLYKSIQEIGVIKASEFENAQTVIRTEEGIDNPFSGVSAGAGSASPSPPPP